VARTRSLVDIIGEVQEEKRRREREAIESLRPTIQPPGIQGRGELTFENYARLARQRGVENPMTAEQFQNLARSTEVQQHRQDRVQQAADFRIANQPYEEARAGFEEREVEREQSAQLTERLNSTRESLAALGQGTPLSAERFRDIALFSAALLDAEGDDDEAVQARAFGAQLLSEEGSRLAPHLDLELGPDWLAANSGRIEDAIEAGQPHGFDKVKDIGAKFLVGTIQAPGVRHVLEGLAEFEQGVLHTTASLAGATSTQRNTDRVAALKHGVSSAARTVGTAVTLGLSDTVGIGEGRLVTLSDGTIVNPDSDLSGDINLREALGADPELGGITGDVLDFVGTILIDPTTYITLGAKPTARVVGKVLTHSADNVSVRAGSQILNGARLSELDAVAQKAVRSELLRYQIDAVGKPGNANLVRQTFGQRPDDVVRTLAKDLRDSDKALDNLIEVRTDRMARAAERGVVPSIRIGNKVVGPRKLWNALGIIDSSLARNEAWAQRLVSTADIKDPGELLNFIQTYRGEEMPQALREDVLKWESMLDLAEGNPQEWLNNLLDQTKADLPLEVQEDYRMLEPAYRKIEAFGRELLGDRGVANWREYVEEWARPTIISDPSLRGKTYARIKGFLVEDETYADLLGVAPDNTAKLTLEKRRLAMAQIQTNPDLSDAVRQIMIDSEDLPLREAVQAFDTENLSYVAQLRLQWNLDVFESPLVWLAKDGIMPTGIRSLANKDTILGNLIRRVSDRGSTRAGIRRTGDLGEQTANRTDNLEAIANAKQGFWSDHVAQLQVDKWGQSALWKKAAKEAGRSDNEMRAFINKVLSQGPDGVDIAVKEAVADGHTETAKLLTTLEAIRRDIFNMSVSAGFDEEVLLASSGYLPRVFSDQARDRAEVAARAGSGTSWEREQLGKFGLINEDGSAAATRSNPLNQGGRAEARTYRRDLQDLYEVNEAAREDLAEAGLSGADGFKLYEDDPIRAMLLRSRQAHEALAYTDMLRGMADTTDLNGRPLAYVATNKIDKTDAFFRRALDDKTFGKSNYARVNFPNGGTAFVRREIMDNLENSRRVLRDPATPGRIKQFMTTWNNIWGAVVTTPLVGLAFHMRNATGNVFNMILAGAKNPGVMADAFKLQQNHTNILRRMTKDGMSFTDSLAAEGLDDFSSQIIRDARAHGVIGSGQVSDIFSDTTPFTELRRGGKFNPLDQRNAIYTSGRKVGEGIENNARLALFLDGRIHKGMKSDDAAARVRQFLFDYTDLTAFESENVRLLSRFYTFTRKNTALQARMLLTQPMRVYHTQQAAEGLVSHIMQTTGFTDEGRQEAGIQDDGSRVPDWAADTLSRFTKGDKSVLAGVDTPLFASQEVLSGIGGLIKAPATLVYQATRGTEFEQREANESFRDQIGLGLGLLSGGPVEAIKTTGEFATGRDLFTGGKLTDVDRNWLDTLTRITDTVMPVLSKVDREAEAVGGYEALGIFQEEGEERRNQGPVRLLNLLFGLTTLPDINDPAQIERNMVSMTFEMKEAVKEMQRLAEEDGVEFPSVDELLDVGDGYRRNEAFNFLIYNVASGEEPTDKQREYLRSQIPRDLLAEIGIDAPASEKAEWSAADKRQKIEKVRTLLQIEGVAMTEQMVHALVMRESGINQSDLARAGIEDLNRKNGYLPGGEPETPEARFERSLQQLKLLSDIYGMSINDMQDMYPLIQPAERQAQQMAEAGYTNQEIASELISGFSRQERAMLFGEDSLDQTFSVDDMTPEEIEKFGQRAAAAESELITIMMISVGRMPTQYETDEWLSEVLFTAPDQRALGFDNYVAPSRVNVTPDSVWDERRRQKVGITQQETNFWAGLDG